MATRNKCRSLNIRSRVPPNMSPVTVHGSVCSFWCLSSLCGSVRCLVTAAGSVIRVLSCSSFALPLSSWRCIVCCRFVNFVLFLCQLSCSLSGQFGLFLLLHWIYLHCLDSHHCGCESLFRLEFHCCRLSHCH